MEKKADLEVDSNGYVEEIGDTGQEKDNLNEGLEHNIAHVSTAGDLSPRHTDTLIVKRGKYMVPLQVQIRSNKGRVVSYDQ